MHNRAPLSSTALLLYALPALPLSAAALPVYVHLPNLYGGSLGLSLALLGTLLLASRLADALIDPLLGALIDRLQRPRLLLGLGLLLLITGINLAFHPPQQAAHDALALWLTAALIPIYLGYSLASITHLSWGSLLVAEENATAITPNATTPNSSDAEQHAAHERTRIATWREGFGLAGVILASLLPTVLGDTPLVALSRFGLLLSVAAAACGGLMLAGAPRPPRQPSVTAEPWRKLFNPLRDAALRRLLWVFLVNGIASALPATLVLFFIGDVLQLPHQAGVFLASYFAAAALGLPLWLRLSRSIGKRQSWLLAMASTTLTFAGALTLQAGDGTGFLLVCLLSGLSLGADLALPAAMLAEHIQQRHARQAARVAGIWNLVSKLNLALAAGLSLPLLQALGYQPGMSDTATPLLMAYCLLPCLLKMLAWLLLQRTPRDI
jgi:Na+/melibiose symporter-like transporter